LQPTNSAPLERDRIETHRFRAPIAREPIVLTSRFTGHAMRRGPDLV
jgi:hypothetical protein